MPTDENSYLWHYELKSNVFVDRYLNRSNWDWEHVKRVCIEENQKAIMGSFFSEMLNRGIEVTVTGIDSIAEKVLVSNRQVRDYTEVTSYILVKTDIHFDTNIPIMGSPLSPVVIAAIAVVIQNAIKFIIIGLTVYGIASVLIHSFLTVTTTITKKKRTTLPDGTVIEEDITETTTSPSLFGQIELGTIMLIIGAIVVLLVFGGSFSATKKGVKVGK